jgi:DNA mismatch endonuclease (patch repair protein)
MAAIRRRDTGPERAVRSLLHARGLRYRVDLPIRLAGHRPIRPDIVFTRQRVAVFIDGCFWHGCPEHGQRPGIRNGAYWSPKIAGNAERDQRHTAALEAAGWRCCASGSTSRRRWAAVSARRACRATLCSPRRVASSRMTFCSALNALSRFPGSRHQSRGKQRLVFVAGDAERRRRDLA